MPTSGSFLSNCHAKRQCFVQTFLVRQILGKLQVQSCVLGSESLIASNTEEPPAPRTAGGDHV